MLDCQVVLDLLDTEGTEARYTRTERVRFLKSASTITDYGWGNGIAFAEHDVSVGRFRRRKLIRSKLRSTVVLDDRQRVGDELTFSVDRTIENGFGLPSEWWLEAEIYHRARRISLEVRLPANRDVISARVVSLDQPEGRALPVHEDSDGQQRIVFEARRPRTGERFRISWTW